MPSTVIASFSYDEATAILLVKFVSGLQYQYLAVPASMYEDMRRSSAKGIFLNRFIKGKYQFRKVETSTE
jgi:hypothetical protein